MKNKKIYIVGGSGSGAVKFYPKQVENKSEQKAENKNELKKVSKKRVAYKCALCGEVTTEIVPDEFSDEKAEIFCSEIIRGQRKPAHFFHKCADGSQGLAYFAGLKEER